VRSLAYSSQQVQQTFDYFAFWNQQKVIYSELVLGIFDEAARQFLCVDLFDQRPPKIHLKIQILNDFSRIHKVKKNQQISINIHWAQNLFYEKHLTNNLISQ